MAHALAGALGILLGGLLGEQLGTSTAIVVGVVGGLTSFAWLWRSPIRKLNHLPDVLRSDAMPRTDHVGDTHAGT